MNAIRFSAASLLALALALTGTPSRAADTSAHRPGLRDQWQPQTEHDPRLSQPVHLEILARAAVPALALLSKETGVSLQVAPENLDTVGERKLTIIAQGCSLKSIMVQIPNALREAHWDIDRSHPEPVYLLHRNSGVDLLPQEERQKALDRRHAERVARFEDICHAVHLDDQQLAELRKTDLLLAGALQDPYARSQIEAFLSLPDECLQQFLATGKTTISYGDADERIRRAVRLTAEKQESCCRSQLNALGPNDGPSRADEWRTSLREFEYLSEHLEESEVQYSDVGLGWGVGIYLLALVQRGDDSSASGRTFGAAVPPVYPHSSNWSKGDWHDVLVRTGMSDESATAALARLYRDGAATRPQHVLDPRIREKLPQPVAVDETNQGRVPKLLAMIAAATDVSVVSDEYWNYSYQLDPHPEGEQPAWRLLGQLVDNDAIDSELHGDMLVLHYRYWYTRAPGEAPVRVVEDCRHTIAAQGGLSLDDLAKVALALHAMGAARSWDLPADVFEAGAFAVEYPETRWPLALYATLSDEQRRQIRSQAGLRLADLSPAQRDLLMQALEGLPPQPKPPSPEDVSNATLTLTQRDGGEGAPSGSHLQFLLRSAAGEVLPRVEVDLPDRRPRSAQGR
jgi:hypothetical protein